MRANPHDGSDAAVVKLNDYRQTPSERQPERPQRRTAPLRRDRAPDLQHLYRARLVYELAESLGVDLRLVVALAASLPKKTS